MKTYKLVFTGSKEDFKIKYNCSTDFGFNYKECNYHGTEQEKYDKFYKAFKEDGNSPLNVKLSMTGKKFDRGILKNEVLKYDDIKIFIEKLCS